MNFSVAGAREYSRVRQFFRKQGILIGDRDMLIAAHVNSLDFTFVIYNVREFTRVSGLEAADWTEVMLTTG